MSKRMHLSDGIPVARWIGSSIGDWACVIIAGGLAASLGWALIVALFGIHPALGTLSALLWILLGVFVSFILDLRHSGTDVNDNVIVMILAYIIGGQFIFGQIYLATHRSHRNRRKRQYQQAERHQS